MSANRGVGPALLRQAAENNESNRLIGGMKDKLHEYRMTKIRECLAEERKKNWIYVGNAYKEPPMGSSKP